MKHNGRLMIAACAISATFSLEAAAQCPAEMPGPAVANTPPNYLFKDRNCSQRLPTRREFKGTATPDERKFEVYYCKNLVTLTVTETERKTRIESDFAAVRKATGAFDARPENCVPQEVFPKYEHGTLKVVAKSPTGEELQTLEVISGLREHLFLGLDLVVTSKDILKYDSTTGTLTPKDENPNLYLSFNYMLGDVLNDPDTGIEKDFGRQFKDNLSIKLFVAASKHPLDSFGVGVGYRLAQLELPGGRHLKNVSVFGGHFWTRQDALTDGTVDQGGSHDKQWRAGITFDVPAMIGSVKW